jgi:hypothetical protein
VRVELLASAAQDAPALRACVSTHDGAFDLPGCEPAGRALRLTWLPVYPALYQGNEWKERMPLPPIVGTWELRADPCDPGVLEVPLDTGWILGGTVVGWDGPVAGAFVSIDQRLPQTVSDIDGRYLVRDIPRRASPVVVGGWAPDRLTHVFEVACPPPDRWVLSADVRLEHAGSIEGLVLDERGAVLADSVVRVLVSPDEDPTPDRRLPFATTGLDGRYRIDGLPVGEYTVVAQAPRSALASAHRTASGDAALRAAFQHDVEVAVHVPALVNLRLAGGEDLTGSVRDSAGAPLEKHGVELWVWTEGPGRAPTAWPVRFATSDAQGGFLLSQVAPGRYRLIVRGPPFHLRHSDGWTPRFPRSSRTPPDDRALRWGAVEWMEDLLVEEGTPPALDVAVAPAQLLSVYAKDVDGRLVRDAELELLPRTTKSPVTVTKMGGDFTLYGALDLVGDTELGLLARVHAPGYLSLVVPVRLRPADGSDKLALHPVALQAAPSLDVLVVDAITRDELPEIAGTLHQRGGGRFDSAHGFSVPGGRFTLHTDRPRGSLVLVVTAPGHKRYRYESPVPADPARAEVLVLLERQE